MFLKTGCTRRKLLLIWLEQVRFLRRFSKFLRYSHGKYVSQLSQGHQSGTPAGKNHESNESFEALQASQQVQGIAGPYLDNHLLPAVCDQCLRPPLTGLFHLLSTRRVLLQGCDPRAEFGRLHEFRELFAIPRDDAQTVHR